ncbi:MAG TPA: DUF4142 domain-containing protein [Pedobacter sp.]|nr:DUF4142 domain-containing protein [Pedobacter sp.]
MKNLTNMAVLLFTASAIAACSGTKSTADASTEGTSLTTGQSAVPANPNTPSSPTGLTSAGVQASVDTTVAQFPVNEKGELSTESFIHLAALAGKKEIELGKVAQQKGQSADVKTIGKMIVDDHTMSDADLKSLAASKNITISLVSDTLKPEQDYKAATQQLGAMSSDKFDRAYLIVMLEDHRRAIALYELGAGSKDPAVKAYAEKYLPKLKTHLDAVQKLTR